MKLSRIVSNCHSPYSETMMQGGNHVFLIHMVCCVVSLGAIILYCKCYKGGELGT